MLVKRTDDWKQFLGPEDEKKLNEILKNVQKYRAAYRQAKDIKTAQLWAALLELKKENQKLNTKLEEMAYIFDGMIERIKKKEQETKDLKESLGTF